MNANGTNLRAMEWRSGAFWLTLTTAVVIIRVVSKQIRNMTIFVCIHCTQCRAVVVVIDSRNGYVINKNP